MNWSRFVQIETARGGEPDIQVRYLGWPALTVHFRPVLDPSGQRVGGEIRRICLSNGWQGNYHGAAGRVREAERFFARSLEAEREARFAL